MRAFMLTIVALAGVLFAGTSAIAGHGHGFGGGGHYHGGWKGGGWHGAYRGGYAGYGGWNRGYYAGNWHRGYYGGWNRPYHGGFYRPYYTGYRGFYGNPFYSYGYRYSWGYPGYVSYRSYYYPSFYRTYYSTPCFGYGYPVYNYYYPSFGYGCYGYDSAFNAPTFVVGGTSLPPTFATSELPYGFDGVRPFVDSLRVNNAAPTTTAAAILRNLAANRASNSVLTRFSGNTVVPANNLAVAPPKADPPTFSPTVSPPLARQRARDMLAIGDRYFREQKYYDASRKYREAAETAPDFAEAHFRNGHALTALNRYDQAVASFRKALALRSDANRDGFKLDDLYGDAHTAKTSHTEALAAAAIEDPNRADHLLLLGMLLHYDGQTGLAEKCFKRSADLDRNLKLAAYVTDNEI